MRNGIARAAGLWGLLLGAAGPAGAVHFVVDSTADAVDAAPGNGVCATAGGACTLRAAVQEANALAGADTITLPAGLFVLSIAGAGENLAATGDLDVTQSLTIQGAGATQTILDANGIDRVIELRFNVSAQPNLTLRDLTVTGGEVSNAQGAGVFFGAGGIGLFERVAIRDNRVFGSATEATGGGISSNGGGNLTVRECVLSGNSADRGGAIFNNSSLLIEDSTLSGNVARASSALDDFGTTILRRSAVTGNESSGNNTIAAGPANLSIEDTTFSANVDPSSLITLFDGTATIRNTTIAFNEVPFALNSSTGGVAQFINSVVHNPFAFGECATSGSGTVASLGYTLDRDGTCATGATGDQPFTDPLLGPLADNGGPTRTHRLLPGSPAIDAGDDFSCTLQDQRGVARPVDGDGDGAAHCDLGAFEAPEPAAAALGVTAAAALALAARRRAASGL